MDTLPNPSTKSTRKARTARSTKRHPSVADLQADIADKKRLLRDVKKRERQQRITDLGMAAWKAGLGDWDMAELERAFRTLAQQGFHALLVLMLLMICVLIASCTSRAPTPDELGQAACIRADSSIASDSDITRCFAHALRKAFEQP